jgi:cation diffusion facilitator CzcD-associated flavoprotein CzcO
VNEPNGQSGGGWWWGGRLVGVHDGLSLHCKTGRKPPPGTCSSSASSLYHLPAYLQKPLQFEHADHLLDSTGSHFRPYKYESTGPEINIDTTDRSATVKSENFLFDSFGGEKQQ